MKKNLITLGLLATMIFATSCVDNEESDAITKMRDAQTAKLNAETAKLNAETKNTDAITAASKAKLEMQKANHELSLASENVRLAEDKLELAIKQAKQDDKVAKEVAKAKAELIAEQANLADAKNKVAAAEAEADQILLIAKQNQAEFELSLQKLKEELAQDIKNHKGTKEAKALENVLDKYEKYTDAVKELEDSKIELVGLQNELVSLQNDLTTVEVTKNKEIEDNNVIIAAKTDLIATLKTYEQYSEDPAALEVIKEKAISEKKKALKASELASDNADTALDLKNEAMEDLASPDVAWFNAMSDLADIQANLVEGEYSAVPNMDDDAEVSGDGHTITYSKKDITKLGSVNMDRVAIKLKDLDVALVPANLAVTNATTALTTATTAYNTAKTAYNAVTPDDATYNSKKSDYETKLQAKEDAQTTLDDANDTVTELSKDKQKINELVALISSSKSELDALVVKFNAAADARANAELAEAKAGDVLTAKSDVAETATSLFNGADTIAKDIADAEKAIKTATEENANLAAITTKKGLIAQKENEISKVENRIPNEEAKVESTKATYEAAKAAL